MTQSQFLRALARKLRALPAAEREEALRYYREYLQEAGIPRGEDVTDRVGTPEQAARVILADSRIRQDRAAAAEHSRESSRHVALCVLAAPAALVVFAVLLAFGASGAGLAACGLALPFMALSTETGQMLVIIGYGILMISVGVLLIVGTAVLWRLTARGMGALLRGKGAKHE